MPLFSILALWVVVIAIARGVLGALYFSVPLVELAILLAVVLAHAPLLRVAVRGISLPALKISNVLLVVAVAAVVFWAAGAYYSDYLGFHIMQDQMGLFGNRNADFSLHLGIANALLQQPMLTENPFYIGGYVAGLPIFDLLVASISRLASIDISTAFYVVSPLLAMCLWFVLALHFRGNGNAVFAFVVIVVFWLAYVDSNSANYNSLAAAYCLALALFGLQLSERLCRHTALSTPKFAANLLILFAMSFFASQNKFLMWAPVAGGVSFTFFALVLVRWRSLMPRHKVQMLIVAAVCVAPVLFLLDGGQTKAAGYYTLGWAPSQPSSLYATFAILCICALLSIVRRAGGRLESGLLLVASAALGILAATVLVPVQYEGGASVYYPIVSVKIMMLVAPVLLLQGSSSVWKEGLRLLVLAVITLSLGVSLTSVTPLWNGRYLERNLTGPDRDTRAAMVALNGIARAGDGVVTNYASLDRYYGFAEFLNVTPFLSSDKYASIALQPDFAERTRIQDLLFVNADLPGFLTALRRDYPQVKFLFIDSALPFNPSPPAESNLTWGNFMPIVFDADRLEQAAEWVTGTGETIQIGYPTGSPEGFRVIAKDLSEVLAVGVAGDLLEPVLENSSVRVYSLYPE